METNFSHNNQIRSCMDRKFRINLNQQIILEKNATFDHHSRKLLNFHFAVLGLWKLFITHDFSRETFFYQSLNVEWNSFKVFKKLIILSIRENPIDSLTFSSSLKSFPPSIISTANSTKLKAQQCLKTDHSPQTIQATPFFVQRTSPHSANYSGLQSAPRGGCALLPPSAIAAAAATRE